MTLVELLVVVLIIGVLSAISIATLLAARGVAGDASAKSMAATARLAARTIALDNEGSFATVRPAALHRYESTIATSSRTGAQSGAYVSRARGTQSSYVLTVTALETGNRYTITRSADGTVRFTCIVARKADPGGCRTGRGRNGTW